jgi:hypothetical protein
MRSVKLLTPATVVLFSIGLLSSCAHHPATTTSRNSGIESAARTHEALSEDYQRTGNDANADYHADKAKEERKKMKISCRRGQCKS